MQFFAVASRAARQARGQADLLGFKKVFVGSREFSCQNAILNIVNYGVDNIACNYLLVINYSYCVKNKALGVWAKDS